MSQVNTDKIISKGDATIDIAASGNVNINSDIYIDAANDRVGINTPTPTRSLDISGTRGFALNSGFIREKVNITGTGISGDTNHDIQLGQVYLWNTATASWTPNFRYNGSETFASQVAVGQTIGFSIVAAVSATDTFCLGVKIDGVAQTVEWAGGTAPDATGGETYNYDSYYYQILRTGTGTTDYIVIASQNSQSGAAGGGTLKAAMTSLNSTLSSYSYNSVSQIKTAFEDLGYTLIATPTYNGMAENQSGTTNISGTGQFNYSAFDSGTSLAVSDGMDNSTLNGYPYMLFAGFNNNGYQGVAAMMYRDYSSAALRDFFAPNQNRNLYAYVLNANGSEVTDASGGTSTIYSDGQSPNSNGYNSTGRFASDDGSWGFRIGASRLDGNGGPYLSDNQSQSYGCENRNGGDASNQDFFWGSNYQSTTSYCFYFAVKNAV
jgi:hypothetical protein